MTSSRQVAYQVLRRVESEGAYANLAAASAPSWVWSSRSGV